MQILYRYIYLYCIKVSQFWLSFVIWWNQVTHVQIHLDVVELEENIIFGRQMYGQMSDMLNYSLRI